MRSTTRLFAQLLAGSVAAVGALAAGTVQVSYVQPERFADIGRARSDRDETLNQLTRHFETLGARWLSDGQTLKVDVLDVDLAGELRPFRHTGQDIRVLKGSVDWPRIKLRYTLESTGQPARSGERQLQDMAYLQRIGSYGIYGGNGALNYEYRLLNDWFESEFGAAASK